MSSLGFGLCFEAELLVSWSFPVEKDKESKLCGLELQMQYTVTRACFYLRDKARLAEVSDGARVLTPLLTIMAATLHQIDNSPGIRC